VTFGRRVIYYATGMPCLLIAVVSEQTRRSAEQERDDDGDPHAQKQRGRQDCDQNHHDPAQTGHPRCSVVVASLINLRGAIARAARLAAMQKVYPQPLMAVLSSDA
jgi:hypothetical protein